MSDDEGTFICYKPMNFREATLKTMGQANRIIAEYAADGFSLTLRQLYYRMVGLGLLETNTKEQYERLGNIISDGRMAGLVSWTAIEDRGRNLMGLPTKTGPKQAVKEARADYRLDLWEDQPCRLEVWPEKQAMEGVVGSICNQLRVDFFSTKGYNSMSEMWRAGRRFAGYVQKGQRPIVLHIADHDPAGIDMTRDMEERLSLFAGVDVQVRRILLNMDQVERYSPPPNYAKETDSKTPAYVAKYGEECWELDALDPHVIRDLISSEVALWRDPALWDAALKQEAADLDELDTIVEEL